MKAREQAAALIKRTSDQWLHTIDLMELAIIETRTTTLDEAARAICQFCALGWELNEIYRHHDPRDASYDPCCQAQRVRALALGDQ